MNNLRNSLEEKNGEVCMAGRELTSLAAKYGTPLYLYDEAWIAGRVDELHKRIPLNNLKFFYAMKANNNPHLLNIIRERGMGIDAVSEGEVHLALSCGFTPDRIIYTANHITDGEMNRVAETGVTMNIGSLSRLEKFGKAHPRSSVCLRFNPDVVAGEFKEIQTGGKLTKFGILMEEAPRVKEITDRYGLTVVGLHKHTGSGIADTALFLQSMDNLLSVAGSGLFPDLRFIDCGGGFKVPYQEEEIPVDYDAFGKALAYRFENFRKEYGRDLSLYFEPGKFVTAEGGIFIVRVNTLKKNRDRLIAGTDSGFPHLIRPLLYGAYHSIINLSNPEGKPYIYDIAGNICESGDLFARDREVAEIREGDYLALLNSGAYCYAMGSEYNMRPLPAEVLLEKDGKDRLIRKRRTPEELAQLIREETLWN